PGRMASWSIRSVQPVRLCRGGAKQRRALFGRGSRGQAFERVPQGAVAARLLVRRKVAFEHAALRAEQRDAGLDIGPPRLRKLGRGRRPVLQMEREPKVQRAEPAELYPYVRTGGDLGQVRLPYLENLVAMSRIGADAERAADM